MQYLPDWFLPLFDKGPRVGPSPEGFAATTEDEITTPDDDATADTSEDVPDPDEVNVEDMLLSAGVGAPCEQQDDLCLDDGFRTGWNDRMQSILDEATERDDLARELDVDTTEIEFEDHDTAFVARNDDRRLGQWESRPALVADLAAARELPDWIEDWDTLAVTVRSQLVVASESSSTPAPTVRAQSRPARRPSSRVVHLGKSSPPTATTATRACSKSNIPNLPEVYQETWVLVRDRSPVSGALLVPCRSVDISTDQPVGGQRRALMIAFGVSVSRT